MKWEEISHDKWLEKLRKELRTENLDTHIKTFPGGIVFDPFIEPVHIESPGIISHTKLAIGIHFSLDEDQINNSAIHRLLPYDLRLISLSVNKQVNLPILLKDIHAEMLFWDLTFDMNPDGNFPGYFNPSNKKPANFSVLKSHFTNSLSFSDKYACYDFSAEMNPVSVLHACNDIWNSQNKIPYCKIRCHMYENILQSIPFLRALRILFETKVPDAKLIIEAVNDLSVGPLDENSQLIKAGSLAMTAKMAGVDHLYFGVMKKMEQAGYFTSILNIQNIMELESQMDQVDDPLNGSFVIENLTQQYLNKIK